MTAIGNIKLQQSNMEETKVWIYFLLHFEFAMFMCNACYSTISTLASFFYIQIIC